jgi:hypothetical protein
LAFDRRPNGHLHALFTPTDHAGEGREAAADLLFRTRLPPVTIMMEFPKKMKTSSVTTESMVLCGTEKYSGQCLATCTNLTPILYGKEYA